MGIAKSKSTKKKGKKKTENTSNRSRKKRLVTGEKKEIQIKYEKKQRFIRRVLASVTGFVGVLFLLYQQEIDSSQLVGLGLEVLSLGLLGLLGTQFLGYGLVMFAAYILFSTISITVLLSIFISSLLSLSLVLYQDMASVQVVDAIQYLGYVGAFVYKYCLVLFGGLGSRLLWFLILGINTITLGHKLLRVAGRICQRMLLMGITFVKDSIREILFHNNIKNMSKRLIHVLFFNKKTVFSRESFNRFMTSKQKKQAVNALFSTPYDEIKSTSSRSKKEASKQFDLPESIYDLSPPDAVVPESPIETSAMTMPDVVPTVAEDLLIEQPVTVKTDVDDSALQVEPFLESSSRDDLDIIPQEPVVKTTKKQRRSKVKGDSLTQDQLSSQPLIEDYEFPLIHYLNQGSKKVSSIKDQTKKRVEQAAILEETLTSFNVKAKVINITPGPSITRFELQPGDGVKISKITGLSKDIALKLAAPDIRIEAPIPGKSLIGIEVPNADVQMITLRSIMEETDFYSKSILSAGIGKTINGESILMDLASMPHVLIAGATGSGKSVCINTIILSILMKAHPDEVKFLMIDPKKVELSLYEGIPHLIAPVVTNPNKAAATLKKWALVEMERRYEEFSKVGVKDIKGYNNYIEEKIKETAKHDHVGQSDGVIEDTIASESLPETLIQEKEASDSTQEEDVSFKKIPYIVVVIDELADLMMVASQDVEQTICRLAQMARATGIHLVIATQRPSVNVVTGLIKANVPSRISFYLQSQIDSRTILDMAGAEKLMGKGDMLYSPSGTFKPMRVQGVFVGEEEVKNVVTHLKEQAQPDYLTEVVNMEPLTKEESTQSKKDDVDVLFEDAKQLIINTKYASTSYLQRKLRIGYNRAARIMDELEAQGVISEYVGEKKARQIN